MCELLVRVRSKPLTGNVAVDCQRTRRGDVIVAMPDGHSWSHEERTNPEWVIVRVPGMTVKEGTALASHEPTGRPHKPRGKVRRHFHKRLFSLDLDALIGPDDGRRSSDVTVLLSALRSAKSAKEPI